MADKKAIIIGATSGIGKELARVLAADGWHLGITGRRRELLESLADELSVPVQVRQMDVADPEPAMASLQTLIDDMGSVDLVVINAGVGHANTKLLWEPEKATIDVNVTGFAAMANIAMLHFTARGGGHLVATSSLAGLRGARNTTAYNASKAFIINYLQGLRHHAVKKKLNIAITDIRPGFVDTPMTKGQKGMFWVAKPDVAAGQIYAAIKTRKKVAYITRRWRLMACIIRLLPDFIWNKT